MHNDVMGEAAINIDDLTPEDRLRLLERLWDSLAARPENVPFTAAQRLELDRRLDEIERGDTAGIPWTEVLQQVRRRAR